MDRGKSTCASCGAKAPEGAARCPQCDVVFPQCDVVFPHRGESPSAFDAAVPGVAAALVDSGSRSQRPVRTASTDERNVGAVLAELLMRARGLRVTATACEEGRNREKSVTLTFAPGDRVTVQVALVLPYYQPWEQLPRGRQSYLPQVGQVAGQLRRALENRRDAVDPAHWLALDTIYLPGASQPQVLGAYLAWYGNPAREFGWKKVWIVGATSATTAELALAGGLMHGGSVVSGDAERPPGDVSIDIGERRGYLHARVAGTNTADNVSFYVRRLFEACIARHCTALLIEANLQGPSLPLLTGFDIIDARLAQAPGALTKIAYVDLNPAHDRWRLEYVKDRMAREGIDMRLFSSADAARCWIETDN